MDDELLDGLASEVAQQLARMQLDVRREMAERLAAIDRNYAAEHTALNERLAEADRQREALQQELGALRSTTTLPTIAAVLLDAEGVLHIVQRNGERFSVRLPDVDVLIRAAVETRCAAMAETLQAEAQAQVARSFELFCNAPPWSATAVYTEGQIVQNHVGRTYRVRQGVKATTGRVPGDDADHWERLGTGGFRVFKSKPDVLSPGDVFTERDARFMHDGATTILFVPDGAKKGDVERAVKPVHGLAQTAQAGVRDLEVKHGARITAQDEAIARTATAANDASDQSVQALANTEDLRTLVDELQRRFDDLDRRGTGS